MVCADRIRSIAAGRALRAPFARTTPSATSAPKAIIRSLMAARTSGGRSPVREAALYSSTKARISLNGFPVETPSFLFIGAWLTPTPNRKRFPEISEMKAAEAAKSSTWRV